jgi:hypothetical protein
MSASPSQFTAFYERKFSDGNYGSEGLALSWSWTNDDLEEGPGESLEAAMVFLRQTVLKKLAASRATQVAFAASRELVDKQPASTTATLPPDDPEELPF